MKTLLSPIYICMIACCLSSCGGSSQKQAAKPEDAKAFFSQYLSGEKITGLIQKSLPNKSDCKTVFKDPDGEAYYTFISQIPKTDMGIDGSYTDVKIESFTTSDILNNTSDVFTGGMARIKDKFQPGITFYKVSLLEKAGDERGMALNYWVLINGRWVFFVKPWRAFKSAE
ncbi:MAG: hypothetical protein IPI66_07550 [Chitinophagaceae bacterium]|nr:hypothetical protein [Chitinophagaceae bacterium]